jgi:hypothetical protein
MALLIASVAMSTPIATDKTMLFGTKPKRPLTPYNLFYRYKRSVILNASSSIKGDEDKIRKLVDVVPGLENVPSSVLYALDPNEIYTLSRDNIREGMKDNLLPFEGKRSHRKKHGMMNFVEMGRMMCDQWKNVDNSIKDIFQELAEEGKRLYHRRLLEYKKMMNDQYNSGAHCAIKNNEVHEPVTKALKLITQVSDRGHQADSVDEHPPPSQLINSSPRPTKYDEVNVVTPVSCNTKFGSYRDFNCKNIADVASSNYKEEDDESCAFIDKNIHPVDIEGVDWFDIKEDLPTTFMDIIDMDEMIDHCKLPY